jgi:hypothetical protein
MVGIKQQRKIRWKGKCMIDLSPSSHQELLIPFVCLFLLLVLSGKKDPARLPTLVVNNPLVYKGEYKKASLLETRPLRSKVMTVVNEKR